MTAPTYSPGLHKLLTLEVTNTSKLTRSDLFVAFTASILQKYQLEKVGLSIHDFENQSFTIAFCLKESHLCVHTWPEFNQLTLDIYLCNYMVDNSEKVREIAQEYIRFFEATIIKDFEINR
ncbi:S-adenosylmethionine decarboxylase family protein [Flavobacterium agrisoli]|uniref:S-adenosylmethionine decarboxylase n=1 Tax=Flavobacterium agrisoli TaxID=2793066 RepID=A0A934PL64_9FLAO|nr:S-adenosylmethionine decarboxylase [Flavobacterium agrisoli]MBK0369622.1 S-adenosylmethionine decarboxylase [Flavobacterium agrisoli]